MSEMGDFWRDVRDARRAAGLPARRSAKPRAERADKATAKALKAMGFEAFTDWHWQARTPAGLVDFWPSKSKWMHAGVVTQGKFVDLQALVARLKAQKEPAR